MDAREAALQAVELARIGATEALEELLASNPEALAARDVDGASLLHLAASAGAEECASALLRRGAACDEPHLLLGTPLMCAVQAVGNGGMRVARLLLLAGAAVESYSGLLGSPLCCAASAGRVECVRLLLQKGARVGVETVTGDAPLTLAARGGHTDVVAALIAAGAAEAAQASAVAAALSWAARREHNSCMDALLAVAPREAVVTALFAAVFGQREPSVRALMRRCGGDVTRPSDGLPLAVAAACIGSVDILRVVLEAGARPDVVAMAGAVPAGSPRSALGAAVRASSQQHAGALVQLLLDAGANVNCRDAGNATPLHLAASRPGVNHTRQLVQQLLAAGANPRLRDARGRTPLFGCGADSVGALLAAGVELEAEDEAGETALVATWSQRRDAAREMLAAGANFVPLLLSAHLIAEGLPSNNLGARALVSLLLVASLQGGRAAPQVAAMHAHPLYDPRVFRVVARFVSAAPAVSR